MTDRLDRKAPHRRTSASARAARVGLGLGVLCAAAALLAGPAYRGQLVGLSTGLQTMRWAAIGGMAGFVIALLALGLGWRAEVPRSTWPAAAALAINLAVAAPLLFMFWTVQHLPRIHDITTDTVDPPRYVAVLPLRAGARNPVDYGAETAALQQRGYPDIAPLGLPLAPAQAFERAEAAARAMGWQIVAVVPADLRIEATDISLLFGFKDDVVIRVRPRGPGSIVDMRSLSRVGGSDFGVNAKRVRAFLRRLADA